MEKLLYELQHEPDYMSDQYIKSYKKGWNDALKTIAELLVSISLIADVPSHSKTIGEKSIFFISSK